MTEQGGCNIFRKLFRPKEIEDNPIMREIKVTGPFDTNITLPISPKRKTVVGRKPPDKIQVKDFETLRRTRGVDTLWLDSGEGLSQMSRSALEIGLGSKGYELEVTNRGRNPVYWAYDGYSSRWGWLEPFSESAIVEMTDPRIEHRPTQILDSAHLHLYLPGDGDLTKKPVAERMAVCISMKGIDYARVYGDPKIREIYLRLQKLRDEKLK